MISGQELAKVGVIVLGTAALMATSGLVLTRVMRAITKDGFDAGVDERVRDTGVIVGKCENILIVALVLVGAYTALTVLFAGKALVRREDMSRNSLYFLAGTMVNVTYSIVAALSLRAVVSRM